MVRKRIRDSYGNWVWEDEESEEFQVLGEKKLSVQEEVEKRKEGTSYDWRDYVALTIASLETYLFPIVILIVIIFGIAVLLAVFH
jgi:hypothetical protein